MTPPSSTPSHSVSTRCAPDVSTRIGSSSIVNTREFAIWPTSTPSASAASCAVVTASSNQTISGVSPWPASTSATRSTEGCESVVMHRSYDSSAGHPHGVGCERDRRPALASWTRPPSGPRRRRRDRSRRDDRRRRLRGLGTRGPGGGHWPSRRPRDRSVRRLRQRELIRATRGAISRVGRSLPVRARAPRRLARLPRGVVVRDRQDGQLRRDGAHGRRIPGADRVAETRRRRRGRRPRDREPARRDPHGAGRRRARRGGAHRARDRRRRRRRERHRGRSGVRPDRRRCGIRPIAVGGREPLRHPAVGGAHLLRVRGLRPNRDARRGGPRPVAHDPPSHRHRAGRGRRRLRRRRLRRTRLARAAGARGIRRTARRCRRQRRLALGRAGRRHRRRCRSTRRAPRPARRHRSHEPRDGTRWGTTEAARCGASAVPGALGRRDRRGRRHHRARADDRPARCDRILVVRRAALLLRRERCRDHAAAVGAARPALAVGGWGDRMPRARRGSPDHVDLGGPRRARRRRALPAPDAWRCGRVGGGGRASGRPRRLAP